MFVIERLKSIGYMYITYKAMFPESAMSLLGYFVLADLVFVTLNDPSK